MKNFLSFFVVVLVFVPTLISCIQVTDIDSHKKYEGHQVVRFHTTTEQQLSSIRDVIYEYNLDMWSHHLQLGDIDIRIPPDLITLIDKLNIPYTIHISDLSEHLYNHHKTLLETWKSDYNGFSASFFDAYRTSQEFNDYLNSVASNYSNLAKVITIGKTYEGRPINGIVISTGINGNTSSKPGIFYNGGQHAREWISPMTVAFIINQLVSLYGTDPQVTQLVDKIEWTLVPVVNVDGYIYTQTDRLWRKNRKPGPFGCIGVDINRNWGFQWNRGGSSNNPCAEDYHGASAFSEPEEKAVADWILAHKNIQGYIDFHSYSQLWMSPWGYSSALPNDDVTQKELGRAAAAAIRGVNGLVFSVGNIYTIIYPASGSSTDWSYGAGNVKWAYGVELRDKGQYGFQLPPSQIVPAGQEIFAAVRVMGDYILKHQA